MEQSFEESCKQNLLKCAEAYAGRKEVKLTTLGRIIANDSPFFARLHDDRKNFTVRKYDEVINWFSSNWPDGLDWPSAVPRPTPSASEPERAA
ncbi:hypothetical protein [Bradyrhizobium sp. AUGA SZCCT0160]|uniref:hypothetical protein n=1 Tax=Bradyrhizobium sp. AUGA SZCCT0160 TaxID=2807662 RepID=UPI001BA8D184|nr:hypothetical protein [Bradyrhizobium sp. AUGA SZCCT0160]MBR1193214.1 hypothetical protein [Bradyrhizobium sp. AUGA SZCCT0160]